MSNIYEIRKAGREYCQTEGSEHYKTGDKVEPIDLIIALGYGEGFCMGSIIKYAARFKQTQSMKDLRKISDYSHIMCGTELGKMEEKENVPEPKPTRYMCNGGRCLNEFIKSGRDVTYCQSSHRESTDEWAGECDYREVSK